MTGERFYHLDMVLEDRGSDMTEETTPESEQSWSTASAPSSGAKR